MTYFYFKIIIGWKKSMQISESKVLSEQFPKKVQMELLKIKWWDWPEQKIMKNTEFFYDPVAFIKKFKEV